MRKLLLGLCASAGLIAGCGGVSAVTFCDQFEVEVCARVYECYDDTTKMSANFEATYGASQSECETKLKSNNCASVTDAHPCADSSTKYHADKADACESDLKAASCATITSGNFTSGNCTAVCS
jgi:hypothetical protein